MTRRLYAGVPTLTQAQANELSKAWIAIDRPDLETVIEIARQLDQAIPVTNIPWVIECDDGQRLEQEEIRLRYPEPWSSRRP